jgi:hypothetical protein
MVSANRTAYMPSTKAPSSRSSRFSTLLSSRSDRSHQTPKPPKPKPRPEPSYAYRMENLSQVALHSSSGTFGTTTTPSIENGETHEIPVPVNAISSNDLGPLRPDKVMNFSHVSLSMPQDGNNTIHADSNSGEMGITRTMEWGVEEEYKHKYVEKEMSDVEP